MVVWYYGNNGNNGNNGILDCPKGKAQGRPLGAFFKTGAKIGKVWEMSKGIGDRSETKDSIGMGYPIYAEWMVRNGREWIWVKMSEMVSSKVHFDSCNNKITGIKIIRL